MQQSLHFNLQSAAADDFTLLKGPGCKMAATGCISLNLLSLCEVCVNLRKGSDNQEVKKINCHMQIRLAGDH